MSSGIDCGKLEEVLESIFQIPVDAAKLDKWVNGGEFETVILGGKEVPTLRNLVRQIDERSSQAAEEEINEAKKEIGALAEKLKAKIEELKALTASAETLPPDHPATAYYNSGTGEIEFGIPQGKQGIQGERGLAPAIDIIYGGDPSDEALSIIYAGNPALDEPGDRTIIRQVARIGTSAQWATANPILEDGESGYERTPEDKLLWKTGDGVTHWNDLPYPSILVDKIYRYRGSVATVEDLPTDAAEGDVYNITSTGANYAWTGTEWDNLGVAGAIDPVPVKDSGNPVASGGVYAALEDMQTDIAATGAPDDVTIIKDESGKLVAQDIAIGGDPTDLASARGVFNSFGTGSIDFNTLTKQGMYSVPSSGSVNGPGFACRMRVQSANGNIVTQVAVGDRQAKYRTLDSTGVWSTWREIVLADRIGDGIRVTDGILSVPEYEGATATEPGTAGLVPPATVEEKDKYLKGDGTYGSGLAASVFTPPTESAPGKAGLVPGPGASSYPENVILTAGLFKEVDLAFMHGSVESVELNKTRLGLGGMSADGVNIDTLTRGGIFTGNTLGGTLPDGVTGGMLVNIMSLGSDGLYYGQQILISYINSRLYFRGNISGIQPGGTVNWFPWLALTPIPQAAAGVGQWIALTNLGSGNSITIPSGGVWCYYLQGIRSPDGIQVSHTAGVVAGGTIVNMPTTSGVSTLGLMALDGG